MSSVKAIALFVLFNALLSLCTGSVEAAQPKHTPVPRSGSLGHTTPRGPAHSNHQWSADPERGWVRREEIDAVNDRRAATKRNYSSKGHSNGKGKKF